MSDAPRVGRQRVRPQLNRASWRATRRMILQRDGWTCRYCGSVADRVDHVIPAELYRGGHDDERNLVGCCVSCNNSKRGLTIEEWYRRTRKPLPAWYRPPDGDGATPTAGYRFADHRHRVSADVDLLIGDMGIPWTGTGCPPGCDLQRP